MLERRHATITEERTAVRIATGVMFCVACVALDVAGSRIAALLGLPLYLDCPGIMLAGIVGGAVPGVVVGFATNLVTSMFDDASIYYTFTSVLVGLAAAGMSRKGFFKTLRGSLAAVLVFALIGGGVGSAITWCLYGFSFGEGFTAPLVRAIYGNGLVVPAPIAQLCGDYLLDVVDKSVSLVVALLFRRAIKATGVTRIAFEPWLQAPLSASQVREVERTPSRSLSIRTKVMLVVSAVMVVSVAATTWISYVMFNDSMVSEQTAYAFGITNLAIQAVDPSRVDDFLEQGEAAEGFAEAEAALAQIRDNFNEVEYIYAYRVLEDGCHVVLDPDTADEPGSDPGDVVPFDEAFRDYYDALLAGEPITDGIVSNETYGWLLTVYVPLYDDEGVCQCYVATDIRMDHIVMDGYEFLIHVITVFGAFFILICVIILWLARYNIVLPLNTLAFVNDHLDFDDVKTRERTINTVCGVRISTGDEIENLYSAIVRTTTETAHHITEAEDQAQTIARMQANLIAVMADLVESRDQFTGDHIRKTTAYVELIMDEMLREGIYASELTDKFVSDVRQSAPLHDVGKIVISDTILNKPGRLTDEEFEIMKTHTTAGCEIIERAAKAVSEPSYLDEAKRIAECHHEKWNGQGYPRGLAREQIPLSARIMAVADVFDALVSKRAYKDGFPLPKAFAIIEEGMGTHFDPQIARAFLSIRDEAARIARENGDVTE